MSTQHRPLSLLTLNVNGLRGPGKVASLFWYLHVVAGNPDVVLLQELHLTSKEELLGALQQGRGRGLPYYATPYFSAGTAASCGVAILVRQGGLLDDDLDESAVHVDTEGRWARIDCMFLRQPLSICCVYAPNAARTIFFTGLHDRVPAGGRVIMGGDFNCVCDPLLDQYPASQTHTTRGEGAQALKWLLAQRQLSDAYRRLEPRGAAFTHTATHSRSQGEEQQSRARLDRWYVSEDCGGWVTSVRHLPCSWEGGGGQPGGRVGDHAGVLLVLEPPGLPTIGPGQDTFPVHLLYDREYLQELRKLTATYFQQRAAPPADVPGARWWWWFRFKVVLLAQGKALNRRWAKEQRRLLWQGLDVVMADGGAPAPPAAAEGVPAGAGAGAPVAPSGVAPPPAAAHQAAQPPQRLPPPPPCMARLIDVIPDRVALAQAIVHNESGERCSAYHFCQAGVGKRASIVAELRAADGVVLDLSTVSSGQELDHVTHMHYSSAAPNGLFKVRPADSDAQDEMLQGLPRKLNSQQQEEAEGPQRDGSITLACLAAALGVSEWGKAPGPDGLPFEVYKLLWEWVGPALEKALGDLFLHGAPGPEWAAGLITLIYKKGNKPRDQLASYRPITLLNCDMKLAGRVLSDRMQPALDYLIDPAQTAFIRGRQITDNVFNRQAVIDYLETAAGAPPGCLLFLDIAKAYDRVNRQWLMRCATAMGLPAGMCKWIELMMAGSTARVNVNSWHSSPFPVDNGLPQGGPPCPPLWVLQLEPLTVALRRAFDAGALVTPTLPGGVRAAPVSHHADDTKLVYLSFRDHHAAAWPIVRRWQAASGADMADDKQGGLAYGLDRVVGRDEATGMRFWREGEERPVSLGLPCSADHAASADAAYGKKLGKVVALASMWGRVPQSMAGRALTAQQLLASQITYLLPCLPPTTQTQDHLQQHQRAIHQYVARSAAAEDRTLSNGATLALLPAPRIAALSRYLGGLSVPDLGSQYVSLAAKMVVMALLPCEQPWAATLRHQLAAVAPHPNWGLAWVVTGLPLTALRGALGAREAAALHMFRMLQLQPCRPKPPLTLPKRALLLMPLFYSAWLKDADGCVFTPPTCELPGDWPFTLGQLATVSTATRSHTTLQRVLAALPASWAAALDAAERGVVDRWAEDRWWVGQDPGTGQRYVKEEREGRSDRFALVGGGGALYWLSASAQAEASSVTVWSPACVLQAFKKPKLWSPAERAVHRAAADAPGGQAAARPMLHQLLGAWEDVRVYPDAWGHGALPLSQYAADNSRLVITQFAAGAAVSGYMPEYLPGRAVRPRLWPPPPAAAGDGGPGPPTSPSGLAAVEQQWLDFQRARGGAEWEQPLQQELQRLGMALAEEPRERPTPRDRSGAGPSGGAGTGPVAAAAAGEAGPPGGAARQGGGWQAPLMLRSSALLGRLASDVEVERARQGDLGRGAAQAAAAAGAGPAHDQHAKYYRLLWDGVPVPNDVKAFALRLLHAALPCRAMHAFMQSIPSGSRRDDGLPFAACRCCSGKDSRGRLVFETYTHVFCACPTFAGAKDWLLDLWECISGVRPPDSAAALVADAPDAWPPDDRPAAGDPMLLWQALRLTLLFYIWTARCSDDPAQRSSRAVVERTISAIRDSVVLHFHRQYHRQTLLRALPRAAFARQQQRPPPALLKVWLCPAIASVHVDEEAVHVQQQAPQREPHRIVPQRLRLHLTMQHPVQAPPAPD